MPWRETMHRHIQSTNAIESLFSNVRQRTDQIDVFTTESSCLAIVWATMQDIRLHKISVWSCGELRAASRANNQPERVVQEGVVCARCPVEPPPHQEMLFLLSLPFALTPFASLGAVLCSARSDGWAGPVFYLCQLVYSLSLHNFQDGITRFTASGKGIPFYYTD
jgi:mutator family transposase